MLLLNRVIGHAGDPAMADKIHHLSHSNAVEYIRLSKADTARKRQRVATDRGTVCGIALDRSETLSGGAVLYLDDERAIVLRIEQERWLRLIPEDAESALELGYHAGNLHWRVKFDGRNLLVALEAPLETYLRRIAAFTDSGRITPDVVDD